MVAITGQVSSALVGKDAFQETDITGITMPITKHNYLVQSIEELPTVFKEAFYIASTGRPGPVLIDIPKDVQQARTVPDWNVKLSLPGYKPTSEPNRKQVRNAVKLLASAKKPIILAGNGIILSGATDELRAFAEHTGIPVITTLHGIGAFPEEHPLCLGMPGMHGWVHVNRAIQECDVLFNIGTRFDDRVTGKASTFAPNARVIHADIDPAEIGKNVKTEVPIVGDAKAVLKMLLEEMPERDSSEWMQTIRELQARHQYKQQYLKREPGTEDQLMPHDVYAAMTRVINERGDYRVVTDVGQHQMWAAQLLDWHRPRTHITSGGSGTMGFALPAALGAAVACPDETIWVVCGDGGFQMTNQELTTIVQEGITNIKVAIVNNGYLGMVRQWQELFEDKRYSHTLLSGPNFEQLAKAYGVCGLTIEERDHVEEALLTAYEHKGTVVMDFRVERETNVFPMVPQGNSIGEMLTEQPKAQAEAAADPTTV
jgi:acetolactate synthase-1/2/3 large subunit